MQLPQALLNSLESVKGFDKEAFIKVHESGSRLLQYRVNPFKKFEILKFKISNSMDWIMAIILKPVLPLPSIHFFMQVVIMCRKQAVCF